MPTRPGLDRSRVFGLSEQLQQIAHLDSSVLEMPYFHQATFQSTRKKIQDDQILTVMRTLGSHQVRSIDIEMALGLSRGGCLKRLRNMVRDGLVNKMGNCPKNTTWSIVE